MNISFVIIVVFFYLNIVRTDDVNRLPPPIDLPCSYTFRCSLESDPVWATDGVKCYLFINPCHLGLENCNREQAHLPPLEVVEKDKCNTKCNADCPSCDKPVCGIRDCKLLDFASICWMDYYNCINGQTYTLNNEGPCKR